MDTVAILCRKLVYYPFIRNIHVSTYGHSGNDKDIPDYLQAVSWMDGCNAQLKLITSEAIFVMFCLLSKGNETFGWTTNSPKIFRNTNSGRRIKKQRDVLVYFFFVIFFYRRMLKNERDI